MQVRHKPLIHVWRRVFREAGIHIPERNIERVLHTTHIRKGETDMHRMDLIAPGIDGVYGGCPIFMDVTIISPLHGTGIPMPHSRNNNELLSNVLLTVTVMSIILMLKLPL